MLENKMIELLLVQIYTDSRYISSMSKIKLVEQEGEGEMLLED